MTKYHLFQWAFRWLPRLPRPLLLGIAVVVGNILWVVVAPMRTRVRQHLAHVPTLAANPKRLQRAVRQSFVQLILNYVDLFSPAPFSNEESATNRFTILSGMDTLQSLRGSGRGTIFVSLHCSAFEAAKYRIRQIYGDEIITPVETITPPELFELVTAERERCGFRFLPVAKSETLRTMITTLRAGKAILLTADRDVLGNGVVMPLFGTPARLPVGIISLVRLTGAAVIWISADRVGLDHFNGTVAEIPLQVTASTRGEEQVTAAFQPLVRILEKAAASYPEQWVASFANDVWI